MFGGIEGRVVFGVLRLYELLYRLKEHRQNRGKAGFWVFWVFMVL